jgi:hypothetical protein
MYRRIALFNAVITFVFWPAVRYAGADHPPSPGVVAVVLLDLSAGALVYWSDPDSAIIRRVG